MKLKIAGGCGEHGRNCFYIDLERFSFLVDCGVMADSEDQYPRLNKDEIEKLRYVFLTHSHNDHTGAIPWLIEEGFKGKIIATKETLNQLSIESDCLLPLSRIHYPLNGLEIEYGKSGHCVGSVWYRFTYKGKSIFFSGDYTENTLIYKTDKIIDMKASVAVIDCAYGNDSISYQDYCEAFLRSVMELKKKYKTILLPVPKYGRGLELYGLIKKEIPQLTFAGDSHFIQQLEKGNKSWFKTIINLKHVELYDEKKTYDIVFVSQPQLKTKEAKRIAESVLKDAIGMMTGTVEKGFYSDQLIEEGKMITCRYPVHLNYNQYQSIVERNSFDRVIPYHCPSIKPDSIYFEI